LDYLQDKSYSAASAASPLVFTTIARRDPNEHDVKIEILFCGVCHSEVHQVRNEWSSVMPTTYRSSPATRSLAGMKEVKGSIEKEQFHERK
jgi:uncharacterized zinc-type alcohol dehydrogenase-like protein